MPKPASTTTRVILICLCLLGLAAGLFWCGHRKQAVRKAAKAAAWEKAAAHLVMVNESAGEWLITIWPAAVDFGKQWRMPAGKSAEAMFTAGEYRVEQKFLADVGGGLTRRFSMRLEAGQAYRWRLINLLASDAEELNVPVEWLPTK